MRLKTFDLRSRLKRSTWMNQSFIALKIDMAWYHALVTWESCRLMQLHMKPVGCVLHEMLLGPSCRVHVCTTFCPPKPSQSDERRRRSWLRYKESRWPKDPLPVFPWEDCMLAATCWPAHFPSPYGKSFPRPSNHGVLTKGLLLNTVDTHNIMQKSPMVSKHNTLSS